MGNIIAAGVLFFLSACAFVLSIRSFMEKGFLFNNAYLYASKQERETMNKKLHYRQSAVVFLFVGLIFLFSGFNALLKTRWMIYAVIALSIAALVYAIASGVRIERQGKQRQANRR